MALSERRPLAMLLPGQLCMQTLMPGMLQLLIKMKEQALQVTVLKGRVLWYLLGDFLWLIFPRRSQHFK